MLVLVAFDLSHVRGIPADVARIGGHLPELVRWAEEGDHHGRRPSSYEVCEVWQLETGVRPVRVARRVPGFLWLDADGLLLDDVRQWTLEPQPVEPLDL
jgi:hypothetical protein